MSIKPEGLTLATVASILNISVPMAAQRAREGSLPFIRFSGDRFVSPETALKLFSAGEWDVAEQTELANRAIYGAQDIEANVRAAADAKRAAEKATADEWAIAAHKLRMERESAARERTAAGADTIRRRA